VISEHVALKRSGRGWSGLCPFHQEKTPSFHVNPERGFFHCFGCNAGGNAFTFLMRVSGLTFPEAVRALAARVGVVVPEGRSEQGTDRLAEINGLAAELFVLYLREGRRAERARAYLEKRGISADTAERFRIGYAPPDGWPEKLRGRGVTDAELARLGLASESRRGTGLYPQFRDRLMFPIEDLGGRVIAFGGRALQDGSGPKYLNSPETPLYRKGHHLYGLGAARDAIRKVGRVILVEGYMDAIAVAQAGVENVAAALGTALTADQLRIAHRFAEDIVICFDGDEAGRRAALRVFPICVEEVDLWPRAVFLPPGEDPDSLVRGQGRAALDALVEKAGSLIDFFLDDLVGTGGVGASTRAARRMAEVLAQVEDEIVRDKLLRGAAGRLGVSSDALLAAARRAWTEAQKRRAPAAREPAPSQRPRPRRDHFSAEAELVELVLCDAEVAARVESEGVFDEFQDAELKSLGENVLQRRARDEHFEPAELLAELPAGMAERVLRRLGAGESGADWQRAADEWFRHRSERFARESRQELIARLRAAEHRGDQEEVAAALEALRQGYAEEDGAEDPASRSS
jgi:DNA primase